MKKLREIESFLVDLFEKVKWPALLIALAFIAFMEFIYPLCPAGM